MIKNPSRAAIAINPPTASPANAPIRAQKGRSVTEGKGNAVRSVKRRNPGLKEQRS